MNDPYFKNKTAIIFGATGGIGSEVSRRLHRDGSHVLLVARNTDRLAQLKAELPGSETLDADIVSSTAVKNVFAYAKEHFGPPELIAHCVGSIPLKAAHQLTDGEWEAALQLNLTSAFYVLREGASLWMSGRHPGSIVFCSSAAATVGLMNHEAIAAAKAGLEGLVRSSAATYATRGVRINAVAPGLVQTPLSSKIWSSEAALKSSLSLHPTRTMGTPNQIASAITWLLSPEQSWVTGQVIHVDGGLSQLKTLGTQ